MQRLVMILTVLLIALLATACGAPIEEPVASATAAGVTATVATPTLRPSATPAPTDEPTSTAVPVATATSRPSPTATQPATATPRPTDRPTSTPRPLPTVPVDEMFDPQLPLAVVGVAPDDVLNVRAEPGVSGAIVGTIPVGAQDIALLGEGRQVGSAVWVAVRYADIEGWVNADYLAEQFGSVPQDVALIAWQALDALRNRALDDFAAYVHPQLGVCFVPFTYISEENPCFSADEVVGLWDDETVILWGMHAASGEPIALTFRDYWAMHIYVADYFRAPMIGYDENMVPGGMIDNSAELFPGSHFVEFHYGGFNPQYEGLDYRTLRIVLALDEGQWYVVAVVDNQWTP